MGAGVGEVAGVGGGDGVGAGGEGCGGEDGGVGGEGVVARVVVVEVGVEEGDTAGGGGAGVESGGELAGSVGDDGGGGEGEGAGGGVAEAGYGVMVWDEVSWRTRWLLVSARVSWVGGRWWRRGVSRGWRRWRGRCRRSSPGFRCRRWW